MVEISTSIILKIKHKLCLKHKQYLITEPVLQSALDSLDFLSLSVEAEGLLLFVEY